MRIALKRVHGKRYIQFISNHERIFHIGSASDFDSWIIAALIWENEWAKQYYRTRADFYDLLECKMANNGVYFDANQNYFNIVRTFKIPPNWFPIKRLKVPHHELFGSLEGNKNRFQRKYRPVKWVLNDWGLELQKRLDEFTKVEKSLEPRNELALTKKERLLSEIRRRNNDIAKELRKNKQVVFSVIREIEDKNPNMVSYSEIFSSPKLKEMYAGEINNAIDSLLKECIIFRFHDCFTTIQPEKE